MNKMKKKLLSWLLVVALVITMVPEQAFVETAEAADVTAGAFNNIRINNTLKNATSITEEGIGGKGKMGGTWHVKKNPNSNNHYTLELNDFDPAKNEGANPENQIHIDGGEWDIILKGTNDLYRFAEAPTFILDKGTIATVRGGGTLNVESGLLMSKKQNASAIWITENAKLIIDDATINAKANGQGVLIENGVLDINANGVLKSESLFDTKGSSSMYTGAGLLNAGVVNVNGGTMTLKGAEDAHDGYGNNTEYSTGYAATGSVKGILNVDGNANVTFSSARVSAQNNNTDSEINIKNGTVNVNKHLYLVESGATINIGTPGNLNCYSLRGNGKLKVTSGEVEKLVKVTTHDTYFPNFQRDISEQIIGTNCEGTILKKYQKDVSEMFQLPAKFDGGTVTYSTTGGAQIDGKIFTTEAAGKYKITAQAESKDKWYVGTQTATIDVIDSDVPQENIQTVKFDANKGTSTMGEVYVDNRQSYVLPESAFTAPANKHFIGWATVAEPTEDNIYSSSTEYVFTDNDKQSKQVTLFAQWADDTYILKYERNNGAATGEMQNQTINCANPEKLLDNKYKLAGYTFGGWYDKKECSGPALTNGPSGKNDKDEVSVYAKWIPNQNTKYIVKHLQQNISGDGYTEVEQDREELSGTTDQKTNAVAKSYEHFKTPQITQKNISGDGSTIVEVKYDRETYDIQWSDGEKVVKTTKVRHGAKPTYDGSVPTKEPTEQVCYEFSGWSPEVVVATQATTYIAQFIETARKYTITFVDDNNSVLYKQELEYGKMPSYEGVPSKAQDEKYTYTFTKWNNEIVKVTGDATYKAEYTKNPRTFQISYNGLKGVVFAPDNNNPKEYTFDQETITLVNPTKEGYIFRGWTESESNEPNLNGQIEKGQFGDKNFTAHWTPITYVVQFDSNGGTGAAMSPLSMTYDQEKNLAKNTYIKEGMVFDGWNTAKNGSGTAYADESSVKNLTDAANGTVILYAQWKKPYVPPIVIPTPEPEKPVVPEVKPDIEKPILPVEPPKEGANIGIDKEQQAETDKTLGDIIADIVKPEVKPEPPVDPEKPGAKPDPEQKPDPEKPQIPQTEAEKETATTEQKIAEAAKDKDTTIKVEVKTDKIVENNAPAEIKKEIAQIKEVVKKNFEEAGTKLLQYVNIDVAAQAVKNGVTTELGNLRNLGKELTFTFVIPDNTDGKKLAVVRYHDGVAEIIPSTCEGNKIVFKTDKFSTYALVEYDKVVTTEPEQPEVTKPGIVQNIDIDTDNGLFKVTFDKLDNATNYRVYVTEAGENNWRWYNAKNGSALVKQLYKKPIEKNGKYQVKVVAYNETVKGDASDIQTIYANRIGTKSAKMYAPKFSSITFAKNRANTTTAKVIAKKVYVKNTPKNLQYKVSYRLKGTKTWKSATLNNGYSAKNVKCIKGLKKGKTYTFALRYRYQSAVDGKSIVYSGVAYRAMKVR